MQKSYTAKPNTFTASLPGNANRPEAPPRSLKFVTTTLHSSKAKIGTDPNQESFAHCTTMGKLNIPGFVNYMRGPVPFFALACGMAACRPCLE